MRAANTRHVIRPWELVSDSVPPPAHKNTGKRTLSPGKHCFHRRGWLRRRRDRATGAPLIPAHPEPADRERRAAKWADDLLRRPRHPRKSGLKAAAFAGVAGKIPRIPGTTGHPRACARGAHPDAISRFAPAVVRTRSYGD